MLMARDESIYQREQSRPGGRGGDQQLEAGVGIGKANARQCFEVYVWQGNRDCVRRGGKLHMIDLWTGMMGDMVDECE
jgi:hypothetical protein